MRKILLCSLIIIAAAAPLFNLGINKDFGLAMSRATTAMTEGKLNAGVFWGNDPEIIARNSLATSSEEVRDFRCDGYFLTAHSVLARNFSDSGSFLELNADNRWPAASLTKLMTAIVAWENIDLNKTIRLSKAVILENDPLPFEEGEIYKIGDLIKAMIVASSNSAAEVAADDFGQPKFIDLMNKKARELGMSETSFYDPTGISPSDQSTVNDLFKLTRYIYSSRPEIFKISRERQSFITELNSGRKIVFGNANQFPGQTGYLGGKTGTTDAAGQNLISLFSFDKQPLAIIILGSQDRFEEARQLLKCLGK